MKRLPHTVGVLAAALLMVAVAACGGGGRTGPTGKEVAALPHDQLVEAAKQEGKVVFAGYISAEFSAAAKQEFEKKYPGVQVQFIAGRVGEIQERLSTEQRIQHVETDLVSSGNQYLEIFRQAGLLQPMPIEKHDYQLPVGESGTWYPMGYFAAGIAVNTEIVAPDKRPRSWTDIADPEWAGKLLMDDPQTGSTGFGFAIEALGQPSLGETYIQKVAAQKPTMVAGTTQPYGQLARGEFPIYFPALEGDVERAAKGGAPVEMVLPTEGVYATVINVGVINKAPHPHAARLLLEYLLSDEALRLRMKVDHMYPSVPVEGVEAPKLLGEPDYQERIKLTSEADAINQRYWKR